MSGKRFYPAIGIAAVAALIAGYAFVNRPAPAPPERIGQKPPVVSEPTVPLPVAKPDIPDGKVIAALALPVVGRELAARVSQSEQGYKTPKPDSKRYSLLGFSCTSTLTVSRLPGAVAVLDFDAPCRIAEPVTIRHKGLVFTAVTSGIGRFRVKIPALARQAVFKVDMADGETVSAEVSVPDAADFDHVAVRWGGDVALQIHAYEPGGGHIWIDNPKTVARAIQGRGGYITLLGDVDFPDAKHAEVYTFPVRRMGKSGVVRLEVRADVTAQICGRDLTAQTLQNGINGGVSWDDLTLKMPACDAGADNLVLNNLLRDLKIAQN